SLGLDVGQQLDGVVVGQVPECRIDNFEETPGFGLPAPPEILGEFLEACEVLGQLGWPDRGVAIVHSSSIMQSTRRRGSGHCAGGSALGVSGHMPGGPLL